MAGERDFLNYTYTPSATSSGGTTGGVSGFDGGLARMVSQTVTLAEAKSLGFNSTQGITKVNGVYYFDTSLAPSRGGFTPVGVAKPGQVQMTPYYGDVTGAYKLTQEQYAAIYDPSNIEGTSAAILRIMRQNEIDALVKSGMTVEEATAQVDRVNKARALLEGGAGGGGLGAEYADKESQDAAAIKYAEQQQQLVMQEQLREAENVMTVLNARFAQYGLESLVPTIRDLAISGATESTITLQLRESEAYKKRFKANEERLKKGLTFIEEADYVGLEDKYRQILRAYGLRQFDTDEYVSQFIANDVSAAELSSRVQTAVTRVQNASPLILSTLTKYYGITQNDLVGYVLDPDQIFPDLERKVSTAEIGAAARTQGIEPGKYVAEQLAAQGITAEQAKRGYSTIAEILPTVTKLSDIYGSTLQGYSLTEAEQEVFNSLASAQRKREKLAQQEVATFSGASGVSRTALSSKSSGGAF